MIGAIITVTMYRLKEVFLGIPHQPSPSPPSNIIIIIIVGHTWMPFSAVSFWSSWWQLERHSLSADGKTEPLNSPV